MRKYASCVLVENLCKGLSSNMRWRKGVRAIPPTKDFVRNIADQANVMKLAQALVGKECLRTAISSTSA